MRFKSVQYTGDPEDDDARFEHALKHQRKYSKEELLFDWDPFWGALEQYEYDTDTGMMGIKTHWFGGQEIADDNAEWRSAEQNWRKKDDRWLRYASIPGWVIVKFLEEGINVFQARTDRHGVPNEHLKAIHVKMRDPEWAWLKTVDMDMGDGNTGNYALGSPIVGNAGGFMPTLPEDSLPPRQPKRKPG